MNDTGSFIPRQTNRPATRKRVTRRIYIISYVVYVMFFGALLTVAGLFVWGLQLDRDLANQKDLLEKERTAFSQSDIIKVQEANKQLLLVEDIINHQTAVSKIFTALEDVTLQSIQISSFVLARSLEDKNAYVINFISGTDNFDSLLFQRDVLSKNPLFANAKIQKIGYGLDDADKTLDVSNSKIKYSIIVPITNKDIPFTGEYSSYTVPVAPDVLVDSEVTDTDLEEENSLQDEAEDEVVSEEANNEEIN